MKNWVSKGLLWAFAGYFLTIILVPVMSGNTLTPFKLGGGAALWIITGLSIGSLFYNKNSRPKAAAKNKRKRKRS